MISCIEAIEQRRSVKHYDPEHQMTDDEVRQLIELAMLSPTSFNIQNWRFVVASDPGLRKDLRAAAWDQAQVTEASLLVLICADLKSWDKQPERYWHDAPKAVQEMLVPMIQPFYKDNPELERDEAIRSCGIASQTLMLAAKAMGYDSCPMIGFDPQKAAELIKLPKDHIIGMMLTIGKATQPAWPRPGQLPIEEVMISNHF